MNDFDTFDCPFCRCIDQKRVAAEYGTVVAILDRSPVTEGHYLIVPKRHVSDYFEMSHTERDNAETMLALLRKQILDNDPKVEGFNVGMNCGEVAGQSVMHAHIHLIPRRFGDVETARGGVRGCVPGKMNY